MASIIDSFRNVFTDNFSLFKIVLITIPVYYAYDLYWKSAQNYTNFYWISGTTLFFLFGILIKVSNNVINEKNMVMPPFNPFKIAYTSIKGIIAIAIPLVSSCFLANYLCSLININPNIDITLKSLIWILVISIVISSFLMFSARERILDAFNVVGLFTKAGDIIFSLIIFILKLIIMNFFTVCFVGYTLTLLFGFGPVLNAFIAFAIIFNLVVIADYFGQLHYEIMDMKTNTPTKPKPKHS